MSIGEKCVSLREIPALDKEESERFFGTLLDNIDSKKVSLLVSADHSTPCINKGHSDDPVPLLISGDTIKKDDAKRVTEAEAKKGSIGLIEGSQVVATALKLIKS